MLWSMEAVARQYRPAGQPPTAYAAAPLHCGSDRRGRREPTHPLRRIRCDGAFFALHVAQQARQWHAYCRDDSSQPLPAQIRHSP